LNQILGTIEILKGNIEEGEKDLEKVINLSECDTDVKVNALIKLGTIKVQDIGKDDSIKIALNCFEEAIKLDENNPDIYLHRAQVRHLLIINYIFVSYSHLLSTSSDTSTRRTSGRSQKRLRKMLSIE